MVLYDPATGRPWPVGPADQEEGAGISLGTVQIDKPAVAQSERPAVADFGPLALVEAGTPATAVSPGDRVPVDLLWQATRAPGEPLVVVIQLLDGQGQVAAGLEEQPLDGRYLALAVEQLDHHDQRFAGARVACQSSSTGAWSPGDSATAGVPASTNANGPNCALVGRSLWATAGFSTSTCPS